MRPTRLLLALLLAAALAPGTWLRTPEKQDIERQAAVEPLPVAATRSGPFELVAGWRLTGDRAEFGGFSALVALDGHRFLAGSDTGRRLIFERPDREARPGTLDRFFEREASAKIGRDVESLAIDPASGTIWAGLEFRQSIVRFSKNVRPDAEIRPELMRRWVDNGGPETLVRLADGRFLAIEEAARRWRGHHHRAVIFAGDPIDDQGPQGAVVEIPRGYRPVDATPVGGGRALVLLRRVVWSIPPGFETAIALVDIDARAPDGAIPARLLTEFGGRIPQDNYEGIALTEDPDGTHIWLVSDDNFMAFQRTLLLKLRWHAREKARE